MPHFRFKVKKLNRFRRTFSIKLAGPKGCLNAPRLEILTIDIVIESLFVVTGVHAIASMIFLFAKLL